MSSTVTSTQSPAPTSPALLTAEEFGRRFGGQNVELVKGQVKELPITFPKHGKICAIIAYLLADVALKKDCGHIMTNDSFVQTRKHPDTVRGPDVCYYSYERLPKGEVPDGLLPVSPDLVVEVRSPSDTWSEVFTKVGEYLGAGVRVVIVLDVASNSASVYRPEELQQIFHNSDELTVPELLPGFAVAVHRLFK
jgi:Uma2 family endonuclease